jgi:hypothetical protein
MPALLDCVRSLRCLPRGSRDDALRAVLMAGIEACAASAEPRQPTRVIPESVA